MESPMLMRDDMVAKASKSKSPAAAVVLPPLPSGATTSETDRAKMLREESLRLNEQLKYFRSSITSSHSDMMNSLEKKVHDFLKDSKSSPPSLLPTRRPLAKTLTLNLSVESFKWFQTILIWRDTRLSNAPKRT